MSAAAATEPIAEESTTTVDLREFVHNPAALKVDRDKGIIFDTKILGWQSANGRTYKPDGVPTSLYEGRRVYVDHGQKANATRSARDVLGWFEGVAKRAEGLFGNFHVLNPKTELAESVFRAAEVRPSLFGFSHHATGREGRDKSGVVIEAVTAVASIDLVSEPATTNSLFEQKEKPMSATDTPKPGDYWQQQVNAVMSDAGMDANAKTIRLAEILRAQSRLNDPTIDQDGADPAVLALNEQVAQLRHEMTMLREERECRDMVDSANLRFIKPEARKAFVKALIPLTLSERTALIEERRHGQRGSLSAPRAIGASTWTPLNEEKVPEDPKALAKWLNG